MAFTVTDTHLLASKTVQASRRDESETP